MNVDLMQVAIAAVRECERQHVGLDRLAALLAGYAYAVDHADRLPTEGDVLHLVGVIEPSTAGRYRLLPVTFADGGQAAAADTVPAATARLFGYLDPSVDPHEFVRFFLSIHPFSDGNGRTAWILLQWLIGALAAPVPLPDYFGFDRIHKSV